MKTNTLFLLICCIINIKCTSQHNTEEQKNNSVINKKYSQIEKVELREQTRGTNRLITFTKESIIMYLNGDHTKSEISAADWENISKEADLLDLSKISTYKSTTTKRFHDGAMASVIMITANGKTFSSTGFDAGIPPKELEGLYNVLKGKSGSITKLPGSR